MLGRQFRTRSRNGARKFHSNVTGSAAVTTVTHLNIGGSGASVTLACGHVVEMEYRPQLPRPGIAYDCPDCRAQEAQALAEQFTSVELARLRCWQWMRLTGRAGS